MTRAVMWRGVRTVQLPLFAPDGIPTAAEWAGDYRARRRTEWAEIIAGHCLANIRFTFSKPDRSNP